ncbi:SAM-dependent methyltransferase [Nocardioides sp. GCM10027113]|uniref:SAM-dependent methyltransferase n=1 Tax=unclassified Nocardioides TaxID=2615069 RepID=UPI00361EF1C4
MFGSRFSRSLARRYRRRGLDRTARRMVDFLVEHGGVQGASVLEIGGGVGDIQVELLRRGATRATNLELVDSYEEDARALAGEAGFAERMTRKQVDLAQDPGAVEPHDIVVLHRVVCCYPDHQRLLGVAAGHARRLLVFSHPPRNPVTRVLFPVANLFFRVRGWTFRTYLHDPEALRESAAAGPLRERYRHRGLTWHVVGLAVPG